MNRPFVSVIIAAYFAEETLLTAINSLKAQVFDNWEAIIVDDHSSDDTYKLATAIAASDPRIKVARLAQNGGPAVARNEGIKLSSGDWIAVLDSDDVYLPCRLANFVKFVCQHDFDMVVDNISDLLQNCSHGNAYWPEWVGVAEEISLLEMMQGCSGLFGNHYGLLKPFVRRSEILTKQIYYDEELRRGEDVNFVLRLMLSGVRVGRISDIGYCYNRPSASSTTNASKKNLSHSYLGIVKIKDKYWQKLTPLERWWLTIRLAQTQITEELDSFNAARDDRSLLEIIMLLLKSKSVRDNVFKARLALKFHRLLYLVQVMAKKLVS